MSNQIKAIKVDKDFYLYISGALAGLSNIYNKYDIYDNTVDELANELKEDAIETIKEFEVNKSM